MEITRSRNKCFDDIANYLITMISLTLAAELYKAGHATRHAPHHITGVDAKQVGKRLLIYSHTVLDEVFAGRRPTRLIMDEEPVQIDASASLHLGVLESPLYALEQAMVVNYFERERLQIEREYGKDTPRWPAEWNFARIVRNSVSHNNEVFFRNASATPVAWHSLTYAPGDNRRKVLHEDLWPADLIYLMMDLDTYLR